MTMIKLKNWKGHELHELFGDYVKVGMAEGKALASQVTGAMVESVNIKKIPDGFQVYVNPRLLRALSGKRYNYSIKYGEIGYTKTPPFHFIEQGFLNTDLGMKPKTSWRARKPSGRNGSGRAIMYSKDIASVDAWVRSKKNSSVKIAGRLAK